MYTDIKISVGSRATVEVQWLVIQWLLTHQFERMQINTYDNIGVDVKLLDDSITDDAIREVAESLTAWGHCLYIGKDGIKGSRLEIDITIDYHGIERDWHYLRIPNYYNNGEAYHEEWGSLNMKEGDFNV